MSSGFTPPSPCTVSIITPATLFSLIHLTKASQSFAGVETNRVSIKEGSHISDLEIYGTESIEGTEEVEGTEVTEDAGSVGEDELLIEAEETEMKFDFGDSEESGSSSQLSEVYTYIVYKTLK